MIKIMVIASYKTLRTTISKLAEGEGREVFGYEALAPAYDLQEDERGFSLVIIDTLQFRVYEVKELLGKLTRIGLKILIITDASKYFMGLDGVWVLEKPYRPEHLSQNIGTILHK